MKQSKTEKTDKQPESDYDREYVPFESAPVFLGRKLTQDDKVQWSFLVKGFSDFRSAQAFEQALTLWKKKSFQFTLMQLPAAAFDKQEEGAEVPWRLSGLSVPVKLPSEVEFYLFTGQLWAMAAHYEGRLENCSFRIAT